jgi:hypothetical protein
MARESTVKYEFFGSANCAGGPSTFGLSVHVWIDWAGRLIHSFYNLSNGKGDKPMARVPSRYARQLRDLERKALADAEEARCYHIDNMRSGSGVSGWLRHAVAVTEGSHGHSVYYDTEPRSKSTLQGYGLTDRERAEVIAAGVPFKDSRGLPYNKRLASMAFPMASCRFDESDVDKGPDRGSLSTCTRHFSHKLWAALGAKVYNTPLETIPGERLVNNELHNQLFAAYSSGNETELGQLMMFGMEG